MNKIERAIDVFLDALNNNTLCKGSCSMCAVGNLCRDGIEKANSPTYTNWALWSGAFFTSNGEQYFSSDPPEYAFEVMSYTEFTPEELAEIEFAFETNTKIYYTDYYKTDKKLIRKDQIRGLAAVVKVMESFPTDKPHQKNYAEEFKSRAKLIPVIQ